MKKFAVLLLALALIFAFAAIGCGGQKGAEKKFLNIATGGTAGTYYPIGGDMAEIFYKAIPVMYASAT